MNSFIKILCFAFISFNTFALNCNSFWAIGFPDPARIHDVINCEQGATSMPFGTEIYYTNELLTNPELTNKLNVVSESLSLSYSIYRAMGDMPRIKVIFYDRPYFDDSGSDTTYAFAFVNFFRPLTEACPILVYPAAFSFNEDKLRQLIAHEVFHCFQVTNYREQTQWGTRHAENIWWLEGSAQFFSNLVYPNADLEYDAMFGRYEAFEALTQQPHPYSAALFFQSLYNITGRNVRYLLEMYSHMPSDGALSQESAVNSLPQMAEHFHKFAQQFFAHEIIDTSGRYAPVPRVEANLVNLTLEEDQTVELINKAFAIIPYKLNLPHKGRYRLQVSGSSLDRYKISIRKSRAPSGTPWQSLPINLEINCSEHEEFDLIITRLGEAADTDSISLQAHRDERADCGCEVTTRPTHACLFGEWVLDHSSMRAFFERMFPPGLNITFEGSSGDYRLNFSPDGTLLWTQTDLTIDSKMVMQGSRGRRSTMNFHQVTNGTHVARYTNIGRDRMCGQDLESNISCVMTITSEAGTFIKPCTMPAIGLGVESTYECGRDTLIHKAVVGAAPDGTDLIVNYIFHRAR